MESEENKNTTKKVINYDPTNITSLIHKVKTTPENKNCCNCQTNKSQNIFNHGQQNINQSSDDSFLLTSQIVNKPPKTATNITRDILIGLFVTIFGGLILYFLTRG